MMSDSLIFSESRFSFLDENAVTGWSAWGLRTTRNGKSWGLQTLRRASAANQSARYENLATKFSQCLRNPCEPADRCASIRAMNAPSSQSPSPDRRPIRRHRRLVGWDYSKGASFFITISTEPRRSLFGRVENRDMVLSPLGERVLESLEAIPAYNPGIALYGHVVMPDHVHLRCHLASGLAEPLQAIGHAIRRFKNHTTKVYRELSASAEPSSALFTPGGGSRGDGRRGDGRGAGRTEFGQHLLWHQGYHDHLCLSRETIDAVEHYIANNPLKWWLMYCDKSLMRVREPLDSPLLDPTGILWRGVGNTELLAPPVPGSGRRIVAMRISRRIPEALLPRVVEDCFRGARAGCVYASTFFSPGEHRLFDALAAAGMPMVKLQTRAIGWGYRPVGLEPELFARKQLLIIAAMGSPSTPSSRFELLELNRQAARIALASPGGMAVHAVPQSGGVAYLPGEV